jgi:hypothetical protein
MRCPSLIAAVFMSLLLGVSSAPAETVWSGLVMANNAPEPTPIPAELNKLEGTLKQLFGYNQFQVIGQSRKTLKRGSEDWVTASKYFSLHVNSKPGAAKSAYAVNLQLFQEQKLLLETEAKLSNRSPLVIKGPQVGDGQLVLLLVAE